jgi:hypothetical protein
VVSAIMWGIFRDTPRNPASESVGPPTEAPRPPNLPIPQVANPYAPQQSTTHPRNDSPSSDASINSRPRQRPRRTQGDEYCCDCSRDSHCVDSPNPTCACRIAGRECWRCRPSCCGRTDRPGAGCRNQPSNDAIATPPLATRRRPTGANARERQTPAVATRPANRTPRAQTPAAPLEEPVPPPLATGDVDESNTPAAPNGHIDNNRDANIPANTTTAFPDAQDQVVEQAGVTAFGGEEGLETQQPDPGGGSSCCRCHWRSTYTPADRKDCFGHGKGS